MTLLFGLRNRKRRPYAPAMSARLMCRTIANNPISRGGALKILRTFHLFICTLPLALSFGSPALAVDALPVVFPETVWNAPKSQPAEGFVSDGVRAVFYDGLPFQGKPTRVFAWVGLPKDASADKKAPAMVLVHGGGGTAFAEWVRLWNSRGYAAIAMDNCGQVPKGSYGKWERHDQSGPPGWGGFAQVDEPVGDQWPFHAVADVLLAHSLLRSLPEVDADRVGLTGISWGGYLTCIVAGVDARYKLAVPVYGCGFLGDDSVWLPDFAKMGKEKADLWLGRWDPSRYLPHAKMPMLWVTGTNDFAYPMDSLQRSYRLPAGNRTLCVRVRMPHGHGGAGENPEEIHVFADSIVAKGEPLPKVVEQGRDGMKVRACFETKRPVVKAELTYTKETGAWQKRKWETADANVDTKTSTVSATLPGGATVYYLNLFDEKGSVVSTEHEEIKAAENPKCEKQ